MQLTIYTDYSLRVLLYLGLHPEKRVTISEIADAYGVSRNHLVKVVHNLAQEGWIQTTRGKSGGMRLAFPPDQINIGAVVRKTEPHMNLLECFDREINTCPIISACALKRVLYQARKAFVDVLDQYTIADALGQPQAMIQILDANLLSSLTDPQGKQPVSA
ncbi:MAG TPA: Rrf2 family transcriptional regulator [Mariprofundaceae bacterium]|nr:Rrf2 family transcriptional regulator [Mariprofundaceae bacterium]